MAGRILRGALHRSLRQIRHVTPVRPGEARGVVAEVYGQVERDFGMLAPPVALHSPAPVALAAGWLLLRESLLAPGQAGRAVKEAVAASVSRANSCPYCADVHGATLSALRPDAEAGALAREHGVESVDAALLPEVLGVALTFHYLNRMVNVFLDDSPLPPDLPGFAREPLLRLLGRITREASGGRERGGGAELLPSAPLPEDLAWAAGRPSLGAAVARAAHAFEAAGLRSVPEGVRALVPDVLAGWDGAPPGPSRAWAEEAVAGLPGPDRAAGRLALLTAMASSQVTSTDVARYRAGGSGDDALIELTAWASFTAARELSARLAAARTGRTPRP